MNGRGAKLAYEVGVRHRARERRRGARRLNTGADDREQVGAKSGGRVVQCAFCGSDQADSFVTTSISRRSFATT